MFEGLNPQQAQAVKETQGPVMILAGAGSGKTKTIVARINYLLDELRVSPFQILAVTFSNKAAREMKERVSKSSGIDLGPLQITTFHAFCAKVLRTEANYIGLSRNFTIYDDSESRAIIKTLIQKRGISLKELSPYEIKYFIEEIKNSGLYIDAPDRDEESISEFTSDPYFEYYREYEEELRRSNAVDFGGLITGVLQLFETYPKVLERYQNRFKYLLVDEYQDTNRAQFHLIKLLSEKTRNICVVGDEDQSIYSWRGADIRNILEYEKVFPDSRLIKLEQNYRSSKTIIEAATHVISQNQMRKGKDMWTDNQKGEFIQVVESTSDKQESEFVQKEVSKLLRDGVSGDDIAIFYRGNAQSRLMEDYLRKARVNYRIVGGIKFYERKEVKDILAYIRLVVNPKDSLALTRVVNLPARGIGTTTLRKLENEAIRQNCSLFEVLQDIVDNYEKYKAMRISSKARSALHYFVGLINEVTLIEQRALDKDETATPSFAVEKLLNESGYLDMLKAEKSYESLARIENIEELLSAITQFEESLENPSLTSFLETITLDQNSLEEEEEKQKEVSLMTVHGSKGLEYPYVFVIGCEETVFPSYQSLESGDMAIEEERRLFYVAMTRAMKKLYLCFAQSRMLWGSLKFNGPTRFLDEIPEHYYEWVRLGRGPSMNSFSANSSFDDFDQSSQRHSEFDTVYTVDKVMKNTYPDGAKVSHKLYGPGVVLESEGIGDNEKVLIRFEEGSRKKFLVKMAPLSLRD